MLGSQAVNHGLMREIGEGRDRQFYMDGSLPDDPAFVGWAVYHLKIGRTIYIMPNDGDHGVYFACKKEDFESGLVLTDPRFKEHVSYQPEKSYSIL